MKTLAIIALAAALCGCEVLKDYDRTFNLVANINQQTGAIEYELRPAAKKGEGTLGGKIRIEGDLTTDGKQVIRLQR